MALVAGAVIGASNSERENPPRVGSAERSAAPPERRADLRRDLGAVLISSFDGTELPAYAPRQLRDGEIGGVILFGRNASSADGLRAITRSLARAGDALVMVDQEGGEIRSVPFAGPAAGQPEQGGPAAVRSLMTSSGRELRGLGVNVNLAPVADVAGADGSVVAGRAFAGGPAAVAAATGASVRGMARAGVGATAKHFPGLGRASANTDDEPVTIAASRTDLERADLVPFRAAIRADVPLVMASHALYPAYDRSRIASQSPALLEGLLRRRLGFRGAVVTDSIEAEAVLRRSSVAVAAERSLMAGADLVLMTGSGSWKLVYPHLLRRARRSSALRARISESATRARRLRFRLRPARAPAP